MKTVSTFETIKYLGYTITIQKINQNNLNGGEFKASIFKNGDYVQGRSNVNKQVAIDLAKKLIERV